MSRSERKPAEPLRTRHVFLDTEVYRRAGFNLSNSSFSALNKYVDGGRVVLHGTDITTGEIHRQLSEMVAETAGKAKRLARDLNRLSQIIGSDHATIGRVESSELVPAAWKGFVETLISGLRYHQIVAQTVPASVVFDRYFRGAPPFSHRGSKEFPDAFVIEALARFCRENSLTMYVVSGDVALRDAAASHEQLLPLATLDDVLAAAAAESGVDHEALVDGVFADPGFDSRLEQAIENELDSIDFRYFGTLPDGSVESPKLREVISVDNYEVAAIDGTAVGLILELAVVLEATIRYLDEEELRDKDEDLIPTELTTWSHSHTRLKMYISIDLDSLQFSETEMMTQELYFE